MKSYEKIGVMLLNIGSPEQPNFFSTANYLRKFLMDRRIISLPFLFRALLVYGFIVPFRSFFSAKKYGEIWYKNESPLNYFSNKCTKNMQKNLGENFIVRHAMRYGSPNFETVLKELLSHNPKTIIAVPMFPQYSSAANGSALEEFFNQIKTFKYLPKIKTLGPFYEEDFFIEALAKTFEHSRFEKKDSHILFSFHGLPLKDISNAHSDKKICEQNKRCPKKVLAPYCYRQQCFQTADLVAQKLGLYSEEYSVCFQSRLGPLPWVQPYFSKTLSHLREKGVKNLTVACPAFVADCLETLHEIGIEAQESWTNLGGEKINLIPCVNSDEIFTSGLAQKIKMFANN